jgi:hypothetical protein
MRFRGSRFLMPMARPVSDGLQAHHAAPRSSQRVRCDMATLIGAMVRIGMFQKMRACTVLLEWGRSCSKNEWDDASAGTAVRAFVSWTNVSVQRFSELLSILRAAHRDVQVHCLNATIGAGRNMQGSTLIFIGTSHP